MPKIRINLVRGPRPTGSPKWALGIFLAAVVILILWGGVQVARRYGPALRTASAPAPVRPQPPKTESQPSPVPAPASGPTAKPAPAPVVPQPRLPPGATLCAVNRLNSNSNSTTIELELNRPVEVRAEALHSPERVFLDLLDTGIAAGMGSAGVITVNVSDPRIQRIRIARRESATRVVLDLNCRCGYSYKMSQQPPYRLVVSVEAR